MPKEIEIRNQLFNESDVLNFFKDNNIKIHKQTHQIDTYYDNPDDSFFKDINHVNDWIRMRNEDGVLSFNYKHWLPEGAEVRTYCEEKEYIINSKEEFDPILHKLGFKGNFKPIIKVDKHRTSFLFQDCEISIDKVTDLGTFIEIEYKGENKNINEALDHIKNTFKKIPANVGPADHKGHAYHLLKKYNDELNS